MQTAIAEKPDLIILDTSPDPRELRELIEIGYHDATTESMKLKTFFTRRGRERRKIHGQCGSTEKR